MAMGLRELRVASSSYTWDQIHKHEHARVAEEPSARSEDDGHHGLDEIGKQSRPPGWAGREDQD